MTSIGHPRHRRSRKPASNRSDRQARPRGSVLALGAAFLTAPAASAAVGSGYQSDCTQGGANYQTVVRADERAFPCAALLAHPVSYRLAKCSRVGQRFANGHAGDTDEPRPVLPVASLHCPT